MRKMMFTLIAILSFFLPFSVQVQNDTVNTDFFGLCDIIGNDNEWTKNTDGLILRSWIQSLVTSTRKFNNATATFLSSETISKAIYVQNGHGTFWKAFGDLKLDGYYYGQNLEWKNPIKKYYYIYPDFQTALYGLFPDGNMKDAHEVKISLYRCVEGVMTLKFKKTERFDRMYFFEPLQEKKISSMPLQRDPHERKLVYVNNSLEIPSARFPEGLFAKRDIPAHSLVAYYGGFFYNNSDETYFLSNRTAQDDEDSAKNIIHFNDTHTIDVSPQYSSLLSFRETLAHKSMHHFTKYNVMYTFVNHPRFGKLRCIESIRPIKKGEEILSYYGYEIDEGPPKWYKKLYYKEFGKGDSSKS